MAGYDLKEGRYDNCPVTDDIMWAAFSRVFSQKSKNDSSYKYAFLKSIIDNIYNVDSELRLSFNQLFAKFTEIYWTLILKYNLKQKAKTKDDRLTYLEQILFSAAEEYNISESIRFEMLPEDTMKSIIQKVKKKCKKYVVGALYEDTNKLFYSFSRRDEWLQINPVMYDFVCKHKIIIEKLNYYEWAKFLEKVNDDHNTSKLLDKIDASSKRTNLSKYRKILYEEFEYKNCFYCGKKLNPKSIDVDHFIPWSFIKDDNIWNMVLSCPTCNRKKNDKLPSREFLRDIIERNKQLVKNNSLPGFDNYQEGVFEEIYYWAERNGYDGEWKPKESMGDVYQNTINYYEKNADVFFMETKDADMKYCREKFMSYLEPGSLILDAGCGSGRDIKAFLDSGFNVEGIDLSKKLCSIAEKYTGIQIRNIGFDEITEENKYDAVWACASLLHVKRADLPHVIATLKRSMKLNGIIYASFKLGDKERISNERFYTDLNEQSANQLFEKVGLKLQEIFITCDVRTEQNETKWINIIAKKQ